MARARPAHWPAVRISLGRSLGPTTTSATTMMTNSSLQAISNMSVSHCHSPPHRRFGRTGSMTAWMIPIRGIMTTGPRSAPLDLIGLLGFYRLMFVGNRLGIVGILQTFLEIPDSVGEIAHESRNLAAAPEQERHDHD